MATNPLTAQGTLNRLRASVTITDSPELNVTPSFLGKDMINVAFDGPVTTFIDTATGAITSPEPYQPVTITVHLLKSQGLSAAYKARIENLSTIGDIVVRPDASTLPDYSFSNCAIMGVNPLEFNGVSGEYVVTLRGYYNVNTSLWDVV